MTFSEYQKSALETDQSKDNDGLSNDASIIVPLLGLAGEAGELLSEYKKQLRDGASHTLYGERVREELGDLLWYLSTVASRYKLSLDDIAVENLRKTKSRWKRKDEQLSFKEETLPHESFPAMFEASIVDEQSSMGYQSRLILDGIQVGATLTDNAYDPDGYRFHDVFHLSYAAMLGWSPVTRALLKRKRRSQPMLDEVEDGGRAVVIEEGVAALVFAYARNHAWLEGVRELDYDLLRTIKSMTAHLEAGHLSPAEWERTILTSFDIWRSIMRKGGGKLRIDTIDRVIKLIS